MKKLPLLFLLLALPARPAPQPPPPLVFTHVTVIDMTGAPPSLDMTVVITGDRITDLGKSGAVRAPEGAQVIDATGKFMIPGLWDMHVHWYHKDYLPLFVANGVTGIRIMWGAPLHQQWRQEIEQGALLGPRLAIASPIVDGPKPIWPGSLAVGSDAEGRQAVIRSKQEGAEFIKVYSRLPREAYFAIADEAKKQGIPFAGHVPSSVTVAEASDAGQKSIEHFTGVLDSCSTREEELRKASADAWANLPEGQAFPSRATVRPLTRLSLETFSPEKANTLYARLARNHTWQCPTLVVQRNMAFIKDPAIHDDPRVKYMPPQIASGWAPAGDFRLKDRTEEDFALARSVYNKLTQLVAPMRRAGVELLAGTDVLNPYCFPGFSLHDELTLLVEAGLSPMEALQAATLNPARYLGKEKDLGTVEKGKIADLVVLDANPLEEIGNTRKIDSVVTGGKLHPKSELQKMLADIETMAGKK
ncbi:MAG TPA: amidohydrolase family protein [Thermoanaerobaculia bacterium]|jgi:imidazolonepropionase-like amidohydrolase|nr:amidohydrolase family protein [Thermoanaerobaculia bacterium]